MYFLNRVRTLHGCTDRQLMVQQMAAPLSCSSSASIEAIRPLNSSQNLDLEAPASSQDISVRSQCTNSHHTHTCPKISISTAIPLAVHLSAKGPVNMTQMEMLSSAEAILMSCVE